MSLSLNSNKFKKNNFITLKSNKANAKVKLSAPVSQSIGIASRLKAVGADPEKAVDKRSWFEKLVNLKEGQNTLFDIIELIGRPQQALFGAVNNIQEGKSVGEGLKSGISGKKRVTGSQLIKNAGGVGPVTSVLGLGLDIIADPMNIAIPIKVAGKVGKGVQVGAKALKGADKAADALRVADTVKDTIKWTNPTELLMKGVGAGVKKAVGTSDNLIEKGLSKLDAARGITYGDNVTKRAGLMKPKVDIRKAEDFFKSQDTQKLIDFARKHELNGGALATYKGAKNTITDTLNAAKDLPNGFITKLREITGRKGLTQEQLAIKATDFNKSVNDYAAVKGITAKEAGEQVMGLMEFHMPAATKSIQNVFEDGATIPYTKEIADKLKDLATTHGMSKPYSTVTNTVTKSKEMVFDKTLLQELDRLTDSGEFGDLITKKYKIRRIYSKEQRDAFKLLDQDVDLRKVFEANPDITKDMLGIIEATQLAKRVGTTLDNYAKHTLTPEAAQFIQASKLKPDALSGILTPKSVKAVKMNAKSFADRTFDMSAVEANNMFKSSMDYIVKEGDPELKKLADEIFKDSKSMKLFETDIQTSVGQYIKMSTEQVEASQKINELLVGSVTDNSELMRFKVDTKLPVARGYTRIDGKKLKEQLNIAKEWTADPKALDLMLKKVGNGNIEIDNRILGYIGNLTEAPKYVTPIVNMIDGASNIFKSMKLLSPGFQLNNFVGNISNMYLSGMSPIAIAQSYTRSSKIIANYAKYQKMIKAGTKNIPDNILQDVEKYKAFKAAGFGGDFANELYDLNGMLGKGDKLVSQNPLAKGTRAITGINAKLNNTMDNYSRLAMFDHATRNAKFVEKLGVNNAAEATRLALFDYMDLSPAEQNVIKKIIPFYTFMKKNLAFQFKNVMKNPVKYTSLKKTINATWDAAGIEQEDAKPYELSSMWIPIPGLTKDGKYTVLKTNLPMADFGEFLDNPGKKVLGSLSPIVKAPFEMATNKQIFTGLPISEFAGQKGNMFKSDVIPGLKNGINRKVEYALSQTGLDVPLRTGLSAVNAAVGFAKSDTKSGGSLVQTIGEGMRIMATSDTEANQVSRDYELLQRLQDALKLVKQEYGGTVPTQNELIKQGLETDDLRKKMEQMLMKYR